MQRKNPDTGRNIRTAVVITAAAAVIFTGGILAGSAYAQSRPADSQPMDKFSTVYDLMKNRWFYSKDSEDIDARLIDQALSGMTSMEEDIHTSYLNLDQAKLFSDSLAGSSVGIGISFVTQDDGNMLIREVYTNSTADSAGLQPGDVITRVGGRLPSQTDTEALIDYIKSFEGKPLEIEVSRNGESQTMTVTPGVFDTTVSVQTGDDYGLITLNSFSADSGTEFTGAIGRVQKSGARNLILDLRNNSGGYVSAARTIVSNLLPDDSTVFVENLRDGTKKELKTDDAYGQVDFDHIYILQNGNTASASEVLIGALKDNLPGKVTTIGTNTYGKGTEQMTQAFDDGTSIKYTIAEWTTPNGTSINKVGFAPDVEIAPEEIETVAYTAMDENSPQIQPDSVDPNAAAVQICLRYLGYPADRSDSYFSPASSEALAQFQQDHGLEPTGIVDMETFSQLSEAASKKLAEESAAHDRALEQAITLIEQSQAS